MSNGRRPFILAVTFVFGLAFHILVLFLFQNASLTPALSHHHHPLGNDGIAQQKERNQFMAEIFEHLIQVESEPKNAFHTLNAEYAPIMEVAFPKTLPTEPFSFEKDILEWECSEDEKAPNLWKASNAVVASLGGVTGGLPFSTFDLENDPYEMFEPLVGSDHFDVEVEYAPKRFRPGYVFKITFIPRNEAHFQRIKQNYYFLIDRSNSIARTRYIANKKAVAEALSYLKPMDTFNILLFDDHVTRFSDGGVPWNEETVASARRFLDEQGHGGIFAATNLYTSLGKIIPNNVPDNEVNTAILLSDGDTFLNAEKQRRTIGKWTERNQGKVSLYSVASGTGNNLPLLEILSAFNKGVLVYAGEHSQVQERLVNLIQAIQHPIGKHITPTAICSDKQMTVLFQPKKKRLPDLYLNRLFTLYGSTNRLSDFYVFLQGKYYDRRFDIKKKISFDKAKMGSPAIERQWTQLLVQELYERYFEDGNFAHLEAAKQLLTPLNLSVPLFEKR